LVFGSLARGEETSTSDVDLLIEMDMNASALGVGGFQHEVAQLLQVSVDVVPTFALPRINDRAFVKTIQTEAKPL
jgi:predicted nucleotidyltransferase